MRSAKIGNGDTIYGQNIDSLRLDAQAASQLLVHQQLGAITLPTNPTNGQTLTLTINGTAVVVTFVSDIGSTPGNVLIGGTATITSTNLNGLLQNPNLTNTTQVALSSANQTLVSYLSFSYNLVTTTTVGSLNSASIAPQTSFTASTTATGGAYTANTMALYVEPGRYFIAGTRVVFNGGSTPNVTAPASNPRIDLVVIDSSGSVTMVTGIENASPAVPAYPKDKLVLAEVYNVTAETKLLDNGNQASGQGYIYNDIRPFLNNGRYVSQTGAETFQATDTGSANTYAAAYNPVNAAVVDGQVLSFRAANANTGDSTFAPDGLTARHIYKFKNVDLVANDILAGQIVEVQYDATNTAWQLLTPPASLSNVSPTIILPAGESITKGQPVTAGFYQSDGGVQIATKATATGTLAAGGGTVNITFDAGSQTNRTLVVFTTFYATSPGGTPVTAMTFNGSALTSQDAQANNGLTSQSYTLIGPASGSHTLALTVGASVSGSYAYDVSIYSYYNSNQSAIDGHNKTGTNSASSTMTLTQATTANGALVVAAMNNQGSSISTSGMNNNTQASSSKLESGDTGIVMPAQTVSVSGTGLSANPATLLSVSIAPVTTPVSGYVFKSSSSTTTPNMNRYNAFLGFALNTASATQNVTVQLGGYVTNQSGLTANTQYYLNDTQGTIGTSAGTNSRKVGIAINATTLAITNIW